MKLSELNMPIKVINDICYPELPVTCINIDGSISIIKDGELIPLEMDIDIKNPKIIWEKI